MAPGACQKTGSTPSGCTPRLSRLLLFSSFRFLPPLSPLAGNIQEPHQSLRCRCRRRRHKINMLDREKQRASTPTTRSLQLVSKPVACAPSNIELRKSIVLFRLWSIDFERGEKTRINHLRVFWFKTIGSFSVFFKVVVMPNIRFSGK